MSSQQSSSPSSYHPYSHLRSGNSLDTGLSPDMQHQPTVTQPPPPQWNTSTYSKYGNPYPTSSSGCTGCDTTCTESMCPTSGHLTSQCTDQCVVIACSDPEHSSLVSNYDFICDEADCTDCNGFDAFLHCYDGNNSCYVSQRQPTRFPQHYTAQHSRKSNSWSSLSDALHENVQSEGSSTSISSRVSNPTTPIFPSTAISSDHQYPSSIGPYHSSSSLKACASIPPTFSPLLQGQVSQHNASQSQHYPRASASSPSSTSTHMLTCMWGNCQVQFASLAELVGHVNLTHLRLPTDTDVSTDRGTNPAETEAQVHIQQVDDVTRLPCLWGDCTEYLQPQHLTGTSSTSAEDIMLSSLASHLFQDHLGLQHFGSGIQSGILAVEHMLAEMLPSRHQLQGLDGEESRESHNAPNIESGVAAAGNANSNHEETTGPTILQSPMKETTVVATPSPQTTTTAVSSPMTSSTEITSGEGHVCWWESCGMSFETCDDLMSHMSVVHVGSGKPQYDCLWEGCTRNGNKGFSSRQKICRHLQSHTGYRPFQCPECLQNFSEAATLQQHIRRHTQEKPYKCDFPGCGKSFAITGALTIHKRIHNGQKPFKCSYCNRGFAESSNLSKHLRTHTGERPYVCPEPGCGKAFARPDQLTRHAGVHRKKAFTTAAEA